MKNYKRIFLPIIILIVIICSIYPYNAETYFIEDGFKYSVSNGYATIIGYEGEETIVEVPLSFSDYVVSTIDIAAFSYNKNITELKLPYLLRYINSSAFSNMTSLKSINIPANCERLGSHSFNGCESLMNINFDSNGIKTIKERTFYNCSALEEFIIPYGTEKIEDFAFANCKSLGFVTIPGSVTNISDSAFSGSNNIKILCTQDSVAQEYAELWGIDYYYIGDANSDGKVNILDVTAIQRYKIGDQELSDYGLKCADVNKDGSVTIRDATLIQMKLAKYDVDF